jgi:hypothetical protein
MTEEKEQDFETTVINLNGKLISQGASYAEQAFGLGCSISIVPVGLLVIIALIIGVRSWIGLLIVGAVGAFLAIAIVALMANKARYNSIEKMYYREMNPEINQYCKSQNISRQQFDQRALEVLPQNAPLCKYLHSGMDQVTEYQE